jgi:tRNA nucleotidyltransferase (CCA-adding enzyme)
MIAMVERGEADALVPERVWQELARGLMEKSPRAWSRCCASAAALAARAPELDETFSAPEVPEHLAARLEHAARADIALPRAMRCW